jgi:hypothetical protein
MVWILFNQFIYIFLLKEIVSIFFIILINFYVINFIFIFLTNLHIHNIFQPLFLLYDNLNRMKLLFSLLVIYKFIRYRILRRNYGNSNQMQFLLNQLMNLFHYVNFLKFLIFIIPLIYQQKMKFIFYHLLLIDFLCM